MCGRMNVTDDPVVQWICDNLGIAFTTPENTDLRPTDPVATVAEVGGSLQQLNTTWGIKPNWSKRQIINARSESVATAKTFRAAFVDHRCLVPCTGWYEWRDEGGSRKQRYSFTHADGASFLMAGIWLPGDVSPELVTLTTTPNERCSAIHNRMPALILPESIDTWLHGSVEQVQPLLLPVADELVSVARC